MSHNPKVTDQIHGRTLYSGTKEEMPEIYRNLINSDQMVKIINPLFIDKWYKQIKPPVERSSFTELSLPKSVYEEFSKKFKI